MNLNLFNIEKILIKLGLKKKEKTAIRMENVSNSTIRGNTIIGFDKAIDIKKGKNIDIDKNNIS